MVKVIKKVAVLLMMVCILSMSNISMNNVLAAESKEWYVYYNDSSNNCKTNTMTFKNYLGYYTAAPTYRSVSTVYTLIQPNTSLGTNFEKNHI